MLQRQRFSGISRNESEEAARAWLATASGVKVVSAMSRQLINRVGGLGPACLTGEWETLIDYEEREPK